MIIRYFKHSLFFAEFFFCFIICSYEHEPYVDNINEARDLLAEQRNQTLEHISEEGVTAEQIQRLITLGLWNKAESYLLEVEDPKNPLRLAKAQLLFKKHEYGEAEQIVASILQEDPENRIARLLQAKLDIQAWRLDKAGRLAARLLDQDEEDAKAGLIKGKIALLNRNFDQALEWSQKLQQWNSDFSGGYWLEAEAHFWSQNPEQAEAPLQKALSIDPFDADARFSYGYAIWRKVDATRLDDMAAQWNMALEVNPLHYLTQWHFGNGHTNLTYADYAHPTDSTVRALLDKGEEFIDQGQIDRAIELSRSVEKEYPESVLPAMMRGSIYYMAYDMDREARLDSAQATFESILEKKQNYGPAHNGLAAVIKQRQFEQLDEYSALEKEIQETPIPPDNSVFYDVFPDAEYYPADRVKKMIAQQIGPSKAYLPMINKFGSDFAIPPLHIDLAEAMGSSYFRYGTTFDNRQWMDIRGVGSGATGIEYLERGAHLERNVLAHEYAHLYHGRILTDHESRRIRSLYHQAMKNNHTLDYYASNNESEFFAQGYAGFLSEEKVHPLNHKSMNTREYIREKDPDFYTFLDSLLNKQQQYLSGDKDVFDDNWAQTYVSLAQQNRDPDVSTAHLDTALSYSSNYIPAILEYAEVTSRQQKFEEAEQYIAKARELEVNYAPTYVAEANVWHQKALSENLSFEESISYQDSLFQRAISLEDDLAELARINRIQRQRYFNYGEVDKAVEFAKKYSEEGAEISTYLRDRKEEAKADYYAMRSSMGYADEAAKYFTTLVDQNPQNFEYRLMYGDALIDAGRLDEAKAVIEEGQRILASADNERDDYKLRKAQIFVLDGDQQKAEEILNSIEENSLSVENTLLMAQLLIKGGGLKEAEEIISTASVTLPSEQADFHYTKALSALEKDKIEDAEELFKTALSANPYHLMARVKLISIFEKQEREDEKENLLDNASQLGISINS